MATINYNGWDDPIGNIGALDGYNPNLSEQDALGMNDQEYHQWLQFTQPQGYDQQPQQTPDPWDSLAQNQTPPPVLGWDGQPVGNFDFTPYEYNGWRPTTDQGTDYPQDQYLDWYYNNPDAQQYINDYWNGGSGDLGGGGDTPGTGNPPPAGGDGGAQDPYTGGQDWSTGGAPYGPGWPSFTTASPIQMAEQDRLQAQAWADLLDQGLRDTQNTYQNFEGNFRDWSLNGPGGYADILAGNGGYTPEQAAGILQEDMLRGGMATASDYNSNFLSPEEMSAIQGDPYAAYKMAVNNLSYLDDWRRQGDTAQRAAVDSLGADLNAAVDPTKLSLSDEYKQNFSFGQPDIDALAEQAARGVGINSVAQQRQLEDAAFAHGNTSPLALAAQQDRIRVQNAIAGADAMSDARLKGKGLQLDVTGQKEAARLASEQDLSNRLRQNASETNQTRLANESKIADDWNNYGRYQTDMKVNTTGQAEAAAAARANQLATNRQGVNQANINTRFGQAGSASSALSGRYGQVANEAQKQAAEGRGYLTGQQDRAQAGSQAAQSNRIGLYGQRMGAIGGATGRATAAAGLPSGWDKAAGFIGGLLGG